MGTAGMPGAASPSCTQDRQQKQDKQDKQDKRPGIPPKRPGQRRAVMSF